MPGLFVFAMILAILGVLGVAGYALVRVLGDSSDSETISFRRRDPEREVT